MSAPGANESFQTWMSLLTTRSKAVNACIPNVPNGTIWSEVSQPANAMMHLSLSNLTFYTKRRGHPTRLRTATWFLSSSPLFGRARRPLIRLSMFSPPPLPPPPPPTKETARKKTGDCPQPGWRSSFPQDRDNLFDGLPKAQPQLQCPLSNRGQNAYPRPNLMSGVGIWRGFIGRKERPERISLSSYGPNTPRRSRR